MILPGYWSTRRHDAAHARQAREQVHARHGRAGAALLRAGERALSAARIAEHGRQTRATNPQPAAAVAAPADTPTDAQAHAARQAARDRRRAELLAQARAALTPAAHEPADHQDPAETSPAGATAHERALTRARSHGRAALQRARRRYR